jgi:CBS domain-containing protein
MLIHEVMTNDVASCYADDTLATVAKLMWEHDCGCIPIVDAKGHPIGIVTDRDVCIAAGTTGKPLSELEAKSFVSSALYVARRDETIESVEDTMAKAQVHRLPVIDAQGRLIGIVSLIDLARASQGTVGERALQHWTGNVLSTLVAVRRPRREQAHRPSVVGRMTPGRER